MPLDYHLTCDNCGIVEHIELIDAKPEPVRGFWAKVKLWWAGSLAYGGNANGDWTRCECIRCYGPGWLPANGGASIAKSVEPDLERYYEDFQKRERLAELLATCYTPWA